ncbi:MAG: aminoacyl-tRNA hydrolase [Tenericutes bacterium]|nr:aminoacyl-tRNA hydrolase [Mycoplasmatota bacterium]
MKLVVGLGNPGKKYEKTRHNCGFKLIDYYASKNNLIFKSKFKGLYSEQIINNEKIIFLKPQSYMNLSGEVVQQFVKYFNINTEDILVVYDDVNYPVGTFKIKRDGSSGGHNGIDNILDLLKTNQITRLKIGISMNEIPLTDYVLSKLTKEEESLIERIMPTVENIIKDFSNNSVDYLMQKYNNEGKHA